MLLGYYIVRDDRIGQALADALIRKAAEGVRVHFLYDAMGSHFLSRRYINRLRQAGVDVQSFYSTRGIWNILQINFRNHRKIAVIDGETAMVGGHNIGVEYLTHSPPYGEWRDTRIRIAGPAVLNIQHIFHGDWIWSTGRWLALDWSVSVPPQGAVTALAVGTGPVEGPEGCSLLFLQLIGMATKRLWIASPYFVPDDAVMKALQLAAARGVDVRILLPAKADNLIVQLASYSYILQCVNSGISLFRFSPGFLHQKVLLVDDHWSCVGTANMDNRSFRLIFEISAVVFSQSCTAEVAQMLENDFSRSAPISIDDYQKLSWPQKVGANISRLFAPIL